VRTGASVWVAGPGLAWLQVGVAGLSWAAMYAYGELPFLWVWLYGQLDGSPRALWFGKLLIAMAIMTPPACLMGASFPYLVRAAAGSPRDLSRPVGLLYGSNTLGAILGAVLGSLVMLPGLWVRGTVLWAVTVNIVGAMLALWGAMAVAGPVRRQRLMGWAVGAAVVLGLVHWQKPPWDPLLMTSGIYLSVSELEDRSRESLLMKIRRPQALLFYDEGLSAVVTVGVQREDGNIWLANNGKVEASSDGDLQTQMLLAHLPFAFRPDAERILVIGLASGITAGSVTLHGAPTRIDIAEIEPAVVEASHEFDEHNHRPLQDPRVHLIVNDARNHLVLTPDGAYDLVTSEPSNPWLTGVSNLFTREFFELGKRKMAPDGVWGQWVHLYSMGTEEVRSLLGTFGDVFAHVRVFRIEESDLLLLGSAAPLPIETPGLARIFLRDAAVLEDLGRVEIRRPETLLGFYLFDQGGVAKLADGVERNTDDNMRIEYAAPLLLHESTEVENLVLLESVAEIPLDAIEETEGLLALARVYREWDETWRRTLATMRAAKARSPDDLAVEVQLRLYERDARREAQRQQ